MRKLSLLIVVCLIGAAIGARAQAQPQLDPELFVYNWGDYIDPQILKEYEEQFGVRVTYDNFASNEELFAKLQAGALYDVVFPSDYMIDRLIKLSLLAELDKANLPNLVNIDPFHLGNYFDPEDKYCIPYQWGTTGLAVSRKLDKVPDSWGALFNPEESQYYADNGGINLLDDQRETLSAALKYLGHSINETDPAKLAEARDLLITALPNIRYINSADYQDTLLIPGEVALSLSWDGATNKARFATETEQNPDGDWMHVTPKEGAVRFQDAMCIPANSTRKATAEHFMNFLMIPENAARTSNLTGFMTANKAAEPLLRPEVVDLFPNEETLEKLEFLMPLDEDALTLWDQTWTEFRASVP
jgi:spermidine/putrescine-binding protein